MKKWNDTRKPWGKDKDKDKAHAIVIDPTTVFGRGYGGYKIYQIRNKSYDYTSWHLEGVLKHHFFSSKDRKFFWVDSSTDECVEYEWNDCNVCGKNMVRKKFRYLVTLTYKDPINGASWRDLGCIYSLFSLCSPLCRTWMELRLTI